MPSIETAQLGVSIDETSTGPILRSAGLNNLQLGQGLERTGWSNSQMTLHRERL